MSIDSNTPVDPRVQIELEKLNTATDNINKYEVELDEAKREFKELLAESIEKIKKSAHKLSNSIQTAKPYYEARLYAAQQLKECQQAAVNNEKAKSIHAAAKEMVYIAEQGLGEKSTLDTACQEMLSHATSRVNQSQIECTETMNILKMSVLKQEVANNRVLKLQSQFKSAIKASSFNIRRSLLLINLVAYEHDLLTLPYYETRANYNGLLKDQKKQITDLEAKVSDAKMTYNEALKNLEQISEEIHRMREERKLNKSLNEIKNDNDALLSSSLSSTTNPLVTPKHSTQINSSDEYRDFPTYLSTKSSPIHQRNISKTDCPHLLKDFALPITTTQPSSLSSAPFFPANKNNDTLSDEIEQWTEIRLSNSESSSSDYSANNSLLFDDEFINGNNGRPSSGGGGVGGADNISISTPPSSASTSSDENRKVTCTVFINNRNGNDKNDDGLNNWITKSNLKSSGRRQSLDMLIDASDRVKDVFTNGLFKVGKSLERRNSESEITSDSSDFFSFTNKCDGLSDEQVENLLLNDDCI